jgi:hypothetical protein
VACKLSHTGWLAAARAPAGRPPPVLTVKPQPKRCSCVALFCRSAKHFVFGGRVLYFSACITIMQAWLAGWSAKYLAMPAPLGMGWSEAMLLYDY